jgi:hypothetical protein
MPSQQIDHLKPSKVTHKHSQLHSQLLSNFEQNAMKRRKNEVLISRKRRQKMDSPAQVFSKSNTAFPLARAAIPQAPKTKGGEDWRRSRLVVGGREGSLYFRLPFSPPLHWFLGFAGFGPFGVWRGGLRSFFALNC